jgi:hypothetical protein
MRAALSKGRVKEERPAIAAGYVVERAQSVRQSKRLASPSLLLTGVIIPLRGGEMAEIPAFGAE